MSKLRDAAQQALEALKKSHPYSNSDRDLDKHSEAIHALRAALAEQPAEQESVQDEHNRVINQTIEQEIQAKGLTAPRITPADVEANIRAETYFTAFDGFMADDRDMAMQDADALKLLTFCVLVLRNGFTVTGESACASPENFDAEIGRKIARQNAVAKVMGYTGHPVTNLNTKT